ncbi:hypothetical protein VE03_02956 [Pseudogymnoascus sp. 23342-1-I1]|nr:hypothetical protein VE03_02956 [Pseudogymnoascus sp. 23342-1-I1]
MSPVFGLFPGPQMTPLQNSTLANAAKVLVDTQMSSSSRSTKLISHLRHQPKLPSDNLWNTDKGPGIAMQIDGNFDFVSGIAEMLLQSHKVVHILPALPAAVTEGSVSGLVARGGFVVDITWSGNALTKTTITSKIGVMLTIRL